MEADTLNTVCAKHMKGLLNMKKKKSTKSIRLPNGFLYTVGCKAITPYLKIKYKFTKDTEAIRDIKPPYLLLCGHTSGMDWLPTVAGMYPQKMNIVTAQHYFYDQPLKTILPWLGAIAKQQFQVDVSSIQKMKKVVALGGVINLFPEGQVSIDGKLGFVHPSIAKLVQFLGIPVVIGKLQGAGACKPKWAKVWRKGPVKFTATPLLTAEQVKQMPREALYHTLVEALAFEEGESIRANGWHYKGKGLAKGLENALYQCPNCGREFSTFSEEDRLVCRACGNTVRIDDQLALHAVGEKAQAFPTIAQWLDWQKKRLREKAAEPGFALVEQVVLKDPRQGSSGFDTKGYGEARFTWEGMRYRGEIDGRKGERWFPKEHLAMIPYACGGDLEIPYERRICVLEPKNKQSVMQWILFSELLREKAQKA